MSEKNISVATWSMRKSLRNPNIGFKGIADFLLENGIPYIELNTLFLKPHSQHTPLIMRLLSVYFKQQPMGQVIGLLRGKGIKPVMLTIEGTNLFQKSKKGINKQMEYIRGWVELAKEAGIVRVRVDLGLKPRFSNNKKMLFRLVKTFTPILEYIKTKDIEVFITTSERELQKYPMEEYSKYLDYLHISVDEGHQNLFMLDHLPEFVGWGIPVCIQIVVTKDDIPALETKIKRCYECGARAVVMPATRRRKIIACIIIKEPDFRKIR